MQNHTIIIAGQADGSWIVEDRTANVTLAKFGAADWADAHAFVAALKLEVSA
jgi:hypothetical protein